MKKELKTNAMRKVCVKQTGRRREWNGLRGFRSYNTPDRSSNYLPVLDWETVLQCEREIWKKMLLEIVSSRKPQTSLFPVSSVSLPHLHSPLLFNPYLVLCSNYTGRTCCSAMATYWRKTSAWAPSPCVNDVSTKPLTRNTLSRYEQTRILRKRVLGRASESAATV